MPMAARLCIMLRRTDSWRRRRRCWQLELDPTYKIVPGGGVPYVLQKATWHREEDREDRRTKSARFEFVS